MFSGREQRTHRLELPTATVEYLDTGGSGPVLVLLHGLLMDSSLWDEAIDELSGDFRCIAPTLPFGAHRQPAPEADLTLRGLAAMVAALLERLDLQDVTLVGNDTGGVLVQLLAAERDSRVGRIVLVSCDAFDNFPPGLTGRTLFMAGKLPPRLFGLFMQQMRLKPVRRLPVAFGWLTKRGDARTRSWLRPIHEQAAIRLDCVRMLRALATEKALVADVAVVLSEFERPALVVWANQDRVMPPADGRRLADLLPRGRFVGIDDSYTLVPLDRPTDLARAVREFVAGG
jgi:pimeloyl-ACP methyl ester carboxylesterase